MKLFKFPLLCLTILSFALPARAQNKEKPTGLSWRGRAHLKLISRHNVKWDIRATYPVFTANTPTARYASWQERLEAQADMSSMAKDFTGYIKTMAMRWAATNIR